MNTSRFITRKELAAKFQMDVDTLAKYERDPMWRCLRRARDPFSRRPARYFRKWFETLDRCKCAKILRANDRFYTRKELAALLEVDVDTLTKHEREWKLFPARHWSSHRPIRYHRAAIERRLKRFF